jgi:hypothetical protein
VASVRNPESRAQTNQSDWPRVRDPSRHRGHSLRSRSSISRRHAGGMQPPSLHVERDRTRSRHRRSSSQLGCDVSGARRGGAAMHGRDHYLRWRRPSRQHLASRAHSAVSPTAERSPTVDGRPDRAAAVCLQPLKPGFTAFCTSASSTDGLCVTPARVVGTGNVTASL